MRKGLYIYVFFFCMLSCPLLADLLTTDPPKPWPVECFPCDPACFPSPLQLQQIDNQVSIDLIDPIYEDGILRTEKGGVLTTRDLRVQARNIVYTKCLDCAHPEFSLYCEGDLLIDYQDKALVGTYFYYDFLTHSGILVDGKTAAPPWYLGGREILFHSDGDLVIYNGYISTSEGPEKDVMVLSPRITVNHDRILTASNINLRLKDVPCFWFPKFKLNLKSIGKSPFAVKFGWGGFLGTHMSVRYRFLTLGDLYGFLRLDGYLGRGPGIGIETEYNPCCSPTEIFTRSYYAHDLSIDDPTKRDRYRLEGSYFTCLSNDLTIQAFYDYVSDADVASNYQTLDFNLNPASRTQIEIRKGTCDWIASLFTRVRINDFQTINQELPTLNYSWHPIEICGTGILFDNRIKTSYLDYRFSDKITEEKGNLDFHSARFSATPMLYRPMCFGPLSITPHAKFIGIAYSNSQGGGSAGQAVGDFGVKAETSLSKCFTSFKHVVEPYVDYHYFTPPTVSVNKVLIFTIQDAYDTLNIARWGLRNTIFTKFGGCLRRPFYFDLWTNTFFDTKQIPQMVPKVYLDAEWSPFNCLAIFMNTAWNFQTQKLDYYNNRLDISLSQNAAFALEYRYRSSHDWRKADFYNFLLETVRSEQELLNSILSDRRDTFLTRIFYRFSPDLWAKFQLRHGWHRKIQPSYTEFEVTLTQVLLQHWHLTFKYEKREVDNRFSFTFKLAPSFPAHN